MLIFARPVRLQPAGQPPDGLAGAFEAPTAARLRGNRRAASPVALSRRAHRDNATVHPSVTRRHCRVVPGSTRSCTRRAPGAHEGNTQGAAGSRPGRARVEPHRLHVRRTFSSWWRHGPRFAPRLAFRARRSPETAAYHVQLSTDRRSDSPPVRRFPRPEGFFESRPEKGDDQNMFSRWVLEVQGVRRGIGCRIRDHRRSERTQPGRAPHTEAGPWSRTCALRPAPSGRARTAEEAKSQYKRIRWTTPYFLGNHRVLRTCSRECRTYVFIALGIAKHTFRAAD